jgi:hypothetical protein
MFEVLLASYIITGHPVALVNISKRSSEVPATCEARAQCRIEFAYTIPEKPLTGMVDSGVPYVRTILRNITFAIADN